MKRLEKEIIKTEIEIYDVYELKTLLETYNAYLTALKHAMNEHRGRCCFDFSDMHNYSYVSHLDELFSNFKNDECLKLTPISKYDTEYDIYFRLDRDTLLRLSNEKRLSSNGGYYIYNMLYKMNNCRFGKYIPKVTDNEINASFNNVIGLFNNGELIANPYKPNIELLNYDNRNIKDILQIQTVDEIYRKLQSAKNEKVKKLIKNI